MLGNGHAAYEIKLENLEAILETNTYLMDRLTGQLHAIYGCTVLVPHLNMDLVWFVGHCFSCGCCGINALGNVVRVYPETIQGLTFYHSET